MFLSMNPNAIHILENNLDKVDWRFLSDNPNAIHIIENNLDLYQLRQKVLSFLYEFASTLQVSCVESSSHSQLLVKA